MANDERQTPDRIFKLAEWLFGPFTLDAAADAANAKCPKFWTKEDDSLKQAWEGIVWCNPPFSRGNLRKFTAKAIRETERGGADRVVMLLPFAGEGWFADNVVRKANLFLLTPRVNYGEGPGAKFGSCFAVYSADRFPQEIAVIRWQDFLMADAVAA